MAKLFLDHFDECNLEGANLELQDLVSVPDLNTKERKLLLKKIRGELEKKHVSLDYLDSY